MKAKTHTVQMYNIIVNVNILSLKIVNCSYQKNPDVLVVGDDTIVDNTEFWTMYKSTCCKCIESLPHNTLSFSKTFRSTFLRQSKLFFSVQLNTY